MMPVVRNPQAINAQRRINPIQSSLRQRVRSAVMAKANGTEKPTYPRYSIGGWNTIPGSCNKGLRSFPSMGTGNSRSNGFDKNRIRPKKPTMSHPCTARITGRCCGYRLRPYQATTRVYKVRIQTQRYSDPSCPPHRAATL